jgi:peptide/nickel transport system permease protein
LIRAEFLSLKEREFVEASRAVGASSAEIIFGEIMPNALAPVIVDASMEVGRAILIEAGLSFLGLGDLNQISWGMMLNNAQPYLRTAWWLAVFPGACIFILVLSLNLVGDGLNDAFNPRLKER